MKMKWLNYAIVVLIALVIILMTLVLTNDRRGGSNTPAKSEESTIETVKPTEKPTESRETREPETESEEESETPSEEESSTETEPATDPQPSESEEVGIVSVNEVAFIGDSRTVFMGSQAVNGVAGSRIIPDDVLFAKYGGTLTDPAMKTLAINAAESGAKKVVIWMGVNDVQVNKNRDSAKEFLANFQNVLNEYLRRNKTKEVYILSILTTSESEKDYYEDQNLNISKYNAELKSYAERVGFHYIDLSPVFRGESDFQADGIHFTNAFYARLLGYLQQQVGFTN